MTLKEAYKVLEQNGYLLATCWTIEDIKQRVEEQYEDTFYTTFTEEDYINIGDLINRWSTWDWETIDNVIEDYARDNNK